MLKTSFKTGSFEDGLGQGHKSVVKVAAAGLTEVQDLARKLRGEGSLSPPMDAPRSGMAPIIYHYHG